MRAQQALAEGGIDAIVESDDLIAAAERMIEDCLDGSLDYVARRVLKTQPVQSAPDALAALYAVAKPQVFKATGTVLARLPKSTKGL